MKQNLIDTEIERVLSELAKKDPTSEEYSKAVDNLKVLYEARSKRAAPFIEPEILVTVAVGLLEVCMVLWHEKLNIITTKAFGMIRFK